MPFRTLLRICPLTIAALVGGLSIVGAQDVASSSTQDSASQNSKSESRVTRLQAARTETASLHAAMHAALQVTHGRFYREDEGLPIPAATMKEVFAELKRKRGISLRWLVVEGQAMNTDHTAKTAFEEAAVLALKSGKPVHEQVDDDTYRRAGPITLSNHCLKCHVPDRRNLRDRTAGLIISVPLRDRPGSLDLMPSP